MNEQKNTVIAVALSMAVLLGFNYFFDRPHTPPPAVPVEVTAPPYADAQPANEVPSLSPEYAPQTRIDREEAIAVSQRIQILGTKVNGSINLKGAQFDDITLVDYHTTPDPNSPEIVLLSPKRTENPYYVSFGWISTNPSLDLPTPETVWAAERTTLASGETITLHWENQQGVRFEREISLDDQYMFKIVDRLHNNSSDTIRVCDYGQITRAGTPPTGGYMILHEGPVGVLDGRLFEMDYDTLKDKQRVEKSTRGGWIGITDKYWLVSLIPDQNTPITARIQATPINRTDRYTIETVTPEVDIVPGAHHEVTHHMFSGAKKLRMLDAYEAELGFDKFDLAVDFGWFYFFTKPLFYVLEYFNTLLGNLGLAILAVTVIFKILFFPLANKSFRSMSRMRQLQPKLEQLKERYAHDKVRMNQELMALYKKEKINPLSGCLPILLQAPVFFCLYKVLFVTLEMRHAPFYGWIQDLSAPDPTSLFNLFGLLPFTPPSFLMIGAWPLLMGLTMFLQQRLNPQPMDPAQAKAFMIMPVMLTFLFASFPAGLVIYWAWSNILSILQQWIIMRTEQPQVPSKR